MRGRVEGWMHRRKAPSKAYTSGSDLGCDGEVLARHPDAPWLYRIVMNIDNTTGAQPLRATAIGQPARAPGMGMPVQFICSDIARRSIAVLPLASWLSQVLVLVAYVVHISRCAATASVATSALQVPLWVCDLGPA